MSTGITNGIKPFREISFRCPELVSTLSNFETRIQIVLDRVVIILKRLNPWRRAEHKITLDEGRQTAIDLLSAMPVEVKTGSHLHILKFKPQTDEDPSTRQLSFRHCDSTPTVLSGCSAK